MPALGLSVEQTEGPKFWMWVMSESKNRGVNDILITVVDGLKGFPEAINAVFPRRVRASAWRARARVCRRCARRAVDGRGYQAMR